MIRVVLVRKHRGELDMWDIWEKVKAMGADGVNKTTSA
jgi:hypothetical protein